MNLGNKNALISGKVNNPLTPTPNNSGNAAKFILLSLLLLLVVAFACWLRYQKNERDRTVTFNSKAQSSAKKTYRNGVEVKPSDLNKVGATTTINDSVVGDTSIEQEETLLDQED